MSRIYDFVLDCGCLVSPDGGGGCIPCEYEPEPTQATVCSQAWTEFRESEDYKIYQEQLHANN